MKTIAIYNQKGGVGKTTISVILAQVLAGQQHRTMIIDGDPQGSATSWMFKKDIGNTFKTTLENKTTESAIYQINEYLYMIPTIQGDRSLRITSELICSERPFTIRNNLKEIENDLDYVIIDCSPGISFLERSIILASNIAFIPMKAEGFSVNGIASTLDFIREINKEFNHNCIKDTIIINDVNKNYSVHRKALTDIQRTELKHIVLPQYANIKKAQMNNELLPVDNDFNNKIKELIL